MGSSILARNWSRCFLSAPKTIWPLQDIFTIFSKSAEFSKLSILKNLLGFSNTLMLYHSLTLPSSTSADNKGSQIKWSSSSLLGLPPLKKTMLITLKFLSHYARDWFKEICICKTYYSIKEFCKRFIEWPESDWEDFQKREEQNLEKYLWFASK